MSTVAEIREAISKMKARSAWDKGVKLYALDLLDNVQENRKLAESDKLAPVTIVELLSGAEDWKEYSYGGCALIYDEDICKRLCPPSVIRRKNEGELPPNSRENWIDVQARALAIACIRFIRLVNSSC